MTYKHIAKTILSGALVLSLAACGNQNSSTDNDSSASRYVQGTPDDGIGAREGKRSTIWDLFGGDNSEVTIKVNKYIWGAALEVLDFLPVQSVDPFSGVIVTGYGTPPGGGRAYRATVYVNDPALDARSLNVAMQTRNGRPVSKSTLRAVEDAILDRARQLRIADGRL